MPQIASKYTDQLPDIKLNIEKSREYNADNVKRYHEFKEFVFKSSMTDDEIGTLDAIGKPTIEFNILEAYISRLRGEFSKQQPSLNVRAADGVPLSMLNKDFIETLDVIESHLRAIFFDGDNDKLEYDVYTDLLAGGFSALWVYTDYVNEMSFEQNIYVDRVFDPTMCGWDPLARESHKGDGGYCFTMHPMTRDDFEKDYGSDSTKDMKFYNASGNIDGFRWSYKGEKDEIVLVCDYYVKVCKSAKIYKLSNGHTVTAKEYDEFMVKWEELVVAREVIEQPPAVIEERRTEITTIEKFVICETCVIKHDKTNYKFLPIPFIDGNSIVLDNAGTSYQMTRPYVYHAKGIQRLKNFAGQSLGNELENLVQSKFIVALESLPDQPEYLKAYTNVQKADVITYQHFLDENRPDVILPPPREVQRTPIPPQISDTFRMSDEMTQAILGSYDGAAGINNAQMSGVSFARSAMQSNSSSLPYIVGFIKGLNRVAQIIVDLIPKYYRTPRSLPVLSPSGKRTYVEINKKGSLYMNYDPNSLQVNVEAGVNFAMQKEIALQTITTLMQSSKIFDQFMNENGLQILLDNIDIRGIDELKEKAAEFEKKLAEQSQQAQQMQQAQMQSEQEKDKMMMQEAQKILQSPTPEQVEMMKVEERSKTDAAEISIKQTNAETNFLEVLASIRNDEVNAELKHAKLAAENARTLVDQLGDASSMVDSEY